MLVAAVGRCLVAGAGEVGLAAAAGAGAEAGAEAGADRGMQGSQTAQQQQQQRLEMRQVMVWRQQGPRVVVVVLLASGARAAQVQVRCSGHVLVLCIISCKKAAEAMRRFFNSCPLADI
jgi:hypothetical protein